VTRRLLVLALAGLALVGAAGAQTVDPQKVVGPPRGQPLEGDALDARTKQVGGLLRCPVCQGLSVADSPASMAVKMKTQVREMLAAGYTEDQILSYFETSYGEFVRLEPPLRGVNWLVWLAPGIALLAGGVVVVMALQRQRRGAVTAVESPSDVPDPEALPEDPRLAACVLRVREMAYGWPGGRSPRQES
jgi:cytochrome c-type biogenesis protein CcmH